MGQRNTGLVQLFLSFRILSVIGETQVVDRLSVFSTDFGASGEHVDIVEMEEFVGDPAFGTATTQLYTVSPSHCHPSHCHLTVPLTPSLLTLSTYRIVTLSVRTCTCTSATQMHTHTHTHTHHTPHTTHHTHTTHTHTHTNTHVPYI